MGNPNPSPERSTRPQSPRPASPEAAVPDDPVELRLLLLALDADDAEGREKVRKVYYGALEGAPNSVSVHHAILQSVMVRAVIKACAASPPPKLNGSGNPAATAAIERRNELLAGLKSCIEGLPEQLQSATAGSHRALADELRGMLAQSRQEVQDAQNRMEGAIHQALAQTCQKPAWNARRKAWATAAVLAVALCLFGSGFWAGYRRASGAPSAAVSQANP